MPGHRLRNRTANADIWPGFVDALTTLLLVIIFLLVVFVLAQVVLSSAITGKDEALDRLNLQVLELTELLDLERQANDEARLASAKLNESLQSAISERDALNLQIDSLSAQAQDFKIRAETAEAALQDLRATTDVDRDTLELRLAEIVSLRQDIDALRRLRTQMESQVADLADRLQESEETRTSLDEELQDNRQQLGALRDRSKQLEAKLADSEERTLLAQKDISQRDISLSELQVRAAGLAANYELEQKLSSERKAMIAALNQQIENLRTELQNLSQVLEIAEERDKKSQVVIADLGRKLNRALASKVEELSRYRSEFFGRLRQVLGARRDISVVGDRFVFQSEVLFESGSADLEPQGQQQLAQLASTLLEISEEIPDDINWVLRIDGHTDSIPISNARFPSNWELSAARAISVVKFLGSQGVPLSRLAATGFADNQPLQRGFDAASLRQNRRIEMKLTQR